MHLLLTNGLGRPQSTFSVSFFNSAHSNQLHEFLSIPSSFCLYNCPCNGFDVYVKFLAIHTISRRYKLKPPQNGNLKKPTIDLSWNIVHMTYTTRIFLKVFWILTDNVKVRDKNSITWMNHRVLINIRVNDESLEKRVCAHAIRNKQGHIVPLQCVSFILFNIPGLWVVFRFCSAGTKIRSYKAA